MNREEAIKVLDSRPYTDEVREALETLIPELKESEDERIRKGLIEVLKTSKTVGELKFILPEPTREECIAYLEKQKEQKPWKVGANAYFTPEQKPAEWSDNDDQLIGFIFDLLNGLVWRKDWAMSKEECLERLKSLRPQPKQEWSEEDVDMLNSCISSIEEAKENRYAYKETDGDTSYDYEIAWLKSLRPSKK